MLIGLCFECRWWEQSPYNATLGECRLTKWDDGGGHQYPSSRAKVQVRGQHDGSAALETAAEFGCVQWEGKS